MKTWRNILNRRTVLTALCLFALAVTVFTVAVSAPLVLAQEEPPRPTSDYEQDDLGPLEAGSSGAFNTRPTPVKKAEAEESNVFLSTFVNLLVGGLARIVIWLEGFVITALIAILLLVVKYNSFATAGAVSNGWTLVRDVANLFFVVVLLGIALATILRVESYNFKKLLPKLILMAILVNFSKVIAGLIIDFAQVVMLTFVAAFAGVSGAGNMVTTLQIQSIITYNWSNAAEASAANFTGTALLMAIMLLITIGVLLVMLVVLVMRIVMLWVLVVLSPLAYIMAAFPQGQRYAQQWWQEFTKYVIVGPVLGFFLWLTFAVASAGDIAQKEFGSQKGLAAAGAGDALSAKLAKQAGVQTKIGQTDHLLSFIIAIAMLMGSLVITQQIGVAGSQFAGSMFNKIRQTGLKALLAPGRAVGWTAKTAAKAPFQFVGRKVNEAIGEGKLPAWASPAGMVRGWGARRAELYDVSKRKAAAAGHEKWEQLFTGTSLPRVSQIELAEESKFAKDFADVYDKEQMAAEWVGLRNAPQSAEIRAKKRGLIKAGGVAGFLDDIMAHPETKAHTRNYIKNLYKTTKDDQLKAAMDEKDEKTGLSLMDNVNDDKGAWYNWQTLHFFLQESLGSDQAGMTTMQTLEDIGKKNGHPEYGGHDTYRSSLEGGHDEMEMERIYDQKDAAGKIIRKSGQKRMQTELSKMQGRSRLGLAPHAFMAMNNDGTYAMGMPERLAATAMFGAQGARIFEHSQKRDWTMAMGGSPDEVNWVEGQETEVANFDKPDASLRNIINHAKGFAFLMQSAANPREPVDVIVKTAWKTTGGKGEPQFQVNGKVYGADEFLSEFGEQAHATPSPAPTPGSAPAPGPSAPMADIDIAKHERTKQAIDAFSAQTGLSAADFYQSRSYKADQYTAQGDFERNEQLMGGWRQEIGRIRPDVDQANPEAVEQAIREEQGKVRGVKSASGKGEGEQAGVGLDFSDKDVQRIFGVNQSQAGAYYKQGDLTKAQKTFLGDKYHTQLLNEGVDEKTAVERWAAFDETLDKVGSLRMTNNSGYASRLETGRHERAHPEIEKLAPAQIDEIYNSIESDRRLQMEAEVKARWGNISPLDAKKEILTQGLASYGRSDAREPLQLTDAAARAMAATGAVKMSNAAKQRLDQAYPEAAVTKGELKTIDKQRAATAKAQARDAKAAAQAERQTVKERQRQLQQREAQNAPVYAQASSALSKLNPSQLGQLWGKLSAAQQSALTEEVRESYPAAARSVPVGDYNLQLAALSRALARTNLEPAAKDSLHLDATVVEAIKSQGIDTASVGTKNELYRQAQQTQGTYQQRRTEYEQLAARKANYGDAMRQKQAENNAEVKQRNEAARTAASRGDMPAAAEARKMAEFLQKENARIDQDVAKKGKEFDVDINKAKSKMQAALDQVMDLETRRRPEPSVPQAVHQAFSTVAHPVNEQARQQAQQVIAQAPPAEVVAAAQEAVDKEGEELKRATGSADNGAILAVLTSIESILEGVKSSLDKLSGDKVNSAERSHFDDLMRQVSLSRGSMAAGGQLDPGSVAGLLRDVNNNLKSIYRKTGQKTGSMPTEIPPKTSGEE